MQDLPESSALLQALQALMGGQAAVQEVLRSACSGVVGQLLPPKQARLTAASGCSLLRQQQQQTMAAAAASRRLLARLAASARARRATCSSAASCRRAVPQPVLQAQVLERLIPSLPANTLTSAAWAARAQARVLRAALEVLRCRMLVLRQCMQERLGIAGGTPAWLTMGTPSAVQSRWQQLPGRAAVLARSGT